MPVAAYTRILSGGKRNHNNYKQRKQARPQNALVQTAGVNDPLRRSAGSFWRRQRPTTTAAEINRKVRNTTTYSILERQQEKELNTRHVLEPNVRKLSQRCGSAGTLSAGTLRSFRLFVPGLIEGMYHSGMEGADIRAPRLNLHADHVVLAVNSALAAGNPLTLLNEPRQVSGLSTTLQQQNVSRRD